jgi:hypothetical protein
MYEESEKGIEHRFSVSFSSDIDLFLFFNPFWRHL